MTSNAQEMPLFDQVLHIYDKSSTKLLAYFTVLTVVTGIALILDIGLGIPPGTVLLYTITLIVLLVVGGPFAYFKYVAYRRSYGGSGAREITASYGLERPEDVVVDKKRAVEELVEEVLAKHSKVLAWYHHSSLRDEITDADRLLMETAWWLPVRDSKLPQIMETLYGTTDSDEKFISKIQWIAQMPHDLLLLQRELMASTCSFETKITLDRVLMTVWVHSQIEIIQRGKSEEFSEGFREATRASTDALYQAVLAVLRRPPGHLPGSPYGMPDMYPGFLKPQKQ